MALGLFGGGDDPDRQPLPAERAVPLDDRSMLRLVEVELEHDAVGLVVPLTNPSRRGAGRGSPS